VLSDVRIVNGVEARIVEENARGSVTHYYYTVGADGVRVHGILRVPFFVSYTYDPPYALLPPGDFSVGTQLAEESTETAEHLLGLGSEQQSFSSQLDVVGFETVTVPAGTFSALVVEQRRGEPDGTSTTSWLVEGLGLVKRETEIGDGISWVDELTSATLLPEPGGGAWAALAVLAGMAARRRERTRH